MLFTCLDGTAYASIWLNDTVNDLNGTFVPLSNPAVSGERVYFLAKFSPFKPYPPGHMTSIIRLYALDVREIMVERIKVIWYHQYELTGTPAPLVDNSSIIQDTARVIIQKDVVVGFLNYVIIPASTNLTCTSPSCKSVERGSSSQGYPGFKSMVLSLKDQGDSYSVNFVLDSQPPFQAVAFVDPTITLAERPATASLKSPPPKDIWVAFRDKDSSYSVISTMDPTTGKLKPAMANIPSLTNISLTSKMTIFYNDQQVEKSNGTSSAVLLPIVFGYTTSSGDAYLAAVDMSSQPPELRWTQKMPSNQPVVGQVTTTGIGRDTMMFVTTGKGAYFYELFSDDDIKH